MLKNAKEIKLFFSKSAILREVRNKPQVAASLPTHIVDEIDKHAKGLEVSRGEYLGLIAKEWFARECPPVTEEEKRLRVMKTKRAS
jgi:hypothetical protein